ERVHDRTAGRELLPCPREIRVAVAHEFAVYEGDVVAGVVRDHRDLLVVGVQHSGRDLGDRLDRRLPFRLGLGGGDPVHLGGLLGDVDAGVDQPFPVLFVVAWGDEPAGGGDDACLVRVGAGGLGVEAGERPVVPA